VRRWSVVISAVAALTGADDKSRPVVQKAAGWALTYRTTEYTMAFKWTKASRAKAK